MRRPSETTELLDWWTRAVAGEEPPRHEGIPEAGWYRMRDTKGGPWVPVEIRCIQVTDPFTGELTEPEKLVAVVPDRTMPAEWVWDRCSPISREDHAALIERREALPVMAASKVKIDLTATPMRPR